MVGFLENQIIKHLSRFVKNLSPDKISISTLKGEGELRNLQLNENIIMDLLDLPSWIRVTRADCNHVSVRVKWTKLSTIPIVLHLDTVTVAMETSTDLRTPQTGENATVSQPGEYGYISKVIDGITVYVDSISLTFTSNLFQGNIDISRLVVESCTPAWTRATDLKLTRIRNKGHNFVLNFKKITWQTVKVEAATKQDPSTEVTVSPLRLIMSSASIHILIKKNLIDSSIICSRIELLTTDLLWVLTSSQLRALFTCFTELKEVIKRSAAQSKMRANEKLKKQASTTSSPLKPESRPSAKKGSHASKEKLSAHEQLSRRYDPLETSYHFKILVGNGTDGQPSADHHKILEGGATQITLHGLSLHYYPFHGTYGAVSPPPPPVTSTGVQGPAVGRPSTRYWQHVDDCAVGSVQNERDQFVEDRLKEFFKVVQYLLSQCNLSTQCSRVTHYVDQFSIGQSDLLELLYTGSCRRQMSTGKNPLQRLSQPSRRNESPSRSVSASSMDWSSMAGHLLRTGW